MNDLYTRPGPGAYELEPWDGTERRGELADRRAIVAPAPEVARALLYLAIGFILGVLVKVAWMHTKGSVSETYAVRFDGPAKVRNYWTVSRITAGDAHDIGPKPCCGSLGQIVVHRKGNVYGVVIQDSSAQKVSVSFNWPFVWGMVLLMVALIALYFGRFAWRNSRMHFGGAR